MLARSSILTLSLAVCSLDLASAQNDECNGAVALTLGQTTLFSTLAATTSFAWPCTSGGNDVWFRVTSPYLGGMFIYTCGSEFDTALEIFTGSCNSLASIACNDNSCGVQSRIIFPVTAATTYYVRVGGANGSTGNGRITASLTGPLFGDECSTAFPVSNGAPALVDTRGATTSLPWTCASAGNDIWFRYLAITQGVSLRIETCGSTFDTTLEVFDGTCGALSSLACNDDQCMSQSRIQLANITAGRTYYIRVGGVNNQTGQGMLSVIESPVPQGCVLNPSFETGDLAGWSVTDLQAPSLPMQVVRAGHSHGLGFFSSAPTEGSHAVVHGFDGDGPGVIRMAQDVAVSSGTTPLTFDYRAAWDMSLPGSTLDRTFDVVVRMPASGTLLQSTRVLTAVAQSSNFDTGPLSSNVDLSPFIGQVVNVSLEWTIPEPFTGPGYFQLDNITCPYPGGVGTTSCMQAANSTGLVGHIRGVGSPLVAANALTLLAERLPENAFGYFITSLTPAFVPCTCMPTVLCLGGQIGRYVEPGQVRNSGATGVISLALDLTRTPTPAGFVPVMVGETRYFQLWHRDLGVTTFPTSNFTDGLYVMFL